MMIPLKEIGYADCYLWQNVIEWFFAKHKIAICVIPTSDTYDSVIGFYVRIYDKDAKVVWYFDSSGSYEHEPKRETYYDVLDLSICDKAILKAIEIVKS